MQVESFIFPVDFIIFDLDVNMEVPFILGRLVMATGRAFIDVAVGHLRTRAHDNIKILNIYKAVKVPTIDEEFYTTAIIDLELEHSLIT